MANVDGDTLAAWVLASDFNTVVGRRLNSDVRAGFPVARAQVDVNAPGASEARLSQALSGEGSYYLPIAATPDEVGNFIQPGDRVDLVIHLGVLDLATVARSETAPAPTRVATTQTLSVPISKLVAQNLEVIRVERDTAAKTTSSQSSASASAARPGDVRRIYLRVDRDQLETLTFALAYGKHTFVIRGANNAAQPIPTDAVTWSDFARWLAAERAARPTAPQPTRQP